MIVCGSTAASPFRKMPAVTDGDYSPCDSSAIVAYHEAQNPEPDPVPTDRFVAPGVMKLAGDATVAAAARYPRTLADVDAIRARPGVASMIAAEARLIEAAG